MGILQFKLNLPATLLNEMKEQQVREVLQIIVIRMRAQVQDLGHRRGSSWIIRPASFIAESSVVPQCPKGRGGRPATSERYPLTYNIGSRLIALDFQWITGDGQTAETLFQHPARLAI
jgi:hypothetical protein